MILVGRWLLFVVVVAAVAYGLFRPEPPPMVFEQSDKVGHVLAFLGLSVSARWVFWRANAYLFWSVMLLLAPLLEYLQGVLRPSRFFSIEDGYANMLGVAVGLVLMLLYSAFSARFRSR